AMAARFAEQGANVAFTYLSSAEKARAVAESLREKGVKAEAYQSDASNFQQAGELIEATLADFGSIDILVNNAGITRDTLLLRMSEEQWDEVMTTNLKSVFNLTKHVLRPMMKNRSGSII